MKKDKLLSLFLVLLMVVAASMAVHKAVFGHSFQKTSDDDQVSDTVAGAVTEEGDGLMVIHTRNLKGTINGYAGPVPLDIMIRDGEIEEVQPLENTETPSFFERASEVLPAWKGRTPEEALALKVDAVSGATYSSSAIINNVKVGLDYYQGVDFHRSTSVPVKVWIAFAVTLVACIVPLFVKNKIYRNVQLIANVIVLGFWSGQFLDYSLILKYTANGFTWPSLLVAVTMLKAAFIYPLFGRPQHYCTHICPLGSAQQLMAQICGYKIKLSSKVLKGLDRFRKLLWAFLMLLLWADCLSEWMDLELFQAFQFESASWGIIIAALFFVFLSAVISRPYCRFICPTGSLFKRSENIG